MKYLLNFRSFIFLMVLFSFFDNFGMDKKSEGNNSSYSSDDSFKRNKRVKIVFVGDAGVGKTQIINRFVNNSFSDVYLETIVNSYHKTINSNGKIIKLQLWDTAGQERFRAITRTYYKSAHLIVFVYAVDDKNTFKNIKNWVKNVKEQTDEKTKFLLIGNKCDLEEERKVSREEAEKYAKDNNMRFIEVSAKNGTNINDDMFNSIIQDFLDDMEKDFTHNNHQYIGPEIPVYSIQDIDDIKTSFCDKYCSCCPCLKKTKKNNEEQEEEEEGDDDDKDDDEEQEKSKGEESGNFENEEQEEIEDNKEDNVNDF